VARTYQSSESAGSTSTLTINTFDNWNLIEERDVRGAQTARYVHGRMIDEIIVMVNKHGTFYPHHDVLGNVTMLTGKDGRLVERYTYSVTGQAAITDAAGKTLTESAVGNRWMFTGREWLQDVGLYDYRNRVYSAELGRFLQTDPIRFGAGDMNIYRYVGNQLSTKVDPFGLDTFSIGISMNLGIFGLSGTASVGIVVDDSWNVGTYTTYGGGGGVDTIGSGSFGISAQYTTGSTIDSYGGYFVSYTATAGAGYGGTVDYVVGREDSGDPILGGGISVGLAGGGGASVNSTWTNVFCLLGISNWLTE
jgi:RHS repeat-associated protein